MKRSLPFYALALTLMLCAPHSNAADEAAEYWINPSVSFDLDADTGVELETAQRFRSSADGRPDTYFARLWINQELSNALALGSALERRINTGGTNETRLIQQLSGRHGILRTRLRLEQRFVEDADHTGVRLRPRAGVAIPIDTQGRISFMTDVETFFTLRSTSEGGDTGLTGLRTQVGFSFDVGERLSLGLAYLRQQDIVEGAQDRVGHAPILGIEVSL